MTMATISTIDLPNITNFYCVYCKEILQFPIRNVHNVGNFCESCFEKSSYTESEINTVYESALTNSVMPCKYSYRGCCKIAKYLDISQHEKKCLYRDKICPFYSLNKCSEDNVQNIVQHFLECHLSQVNIVETDTAELNYKINQDLNEFWVIIFNDANILLNIKVKEDKLFVIIYCIGNIEDVPDLKCIIELRNDDISTHPRVCGIPHEEFTDSFDDNSGIQYDLKMLANYFGQNLVTSLTMQKTTATISKEDILERLECPVCNNFMKSNIMLCITGHSICSFCQSKLERCPICTLPFKNARNYTLESISDLLNIKSIIKYECPLRKELQCPWKGSEQNVIEHVKDIHSNKIVVKNSLTTKILTYTVEFAEINYLMTFGQVFKVTCRKDKYDDVMIVIIELIGHDEDAQKYNYNISLNSLYKQNIIWYTKSKVFTRRRIEYHADYIAIGRIVCNNQFNMSYGIIKNVHY